MSFNGMWKNRSFYLVKSLKIEGGHFGDFQVGSVRKVYNDTVGKVSLLSRTGDRDYGGGDRGLGPGLPLS